MYYLYRVRNAEASICTVLETHKLLIGLGARHNYLVNQEHKYISG